LANGIVSCLICAKHPRFTATSGSSSYGFLESIYPCRPGSIPDVNPRRIVTHSLTHSRLVGSAVLGGHFTRSPTTHADRLQVAYIFSDTATSQNVR